MRAVGLVLVAAGFAGGALAAVVDPEGVPWLLFVPCALAAALGVGLVQAAARRIARDVSRIEADFRTLDERLRRIVGDVNALDLEEDGLDVYELPDRIDQRLPREILAFVDARASLAHAAGTRAYADVMSHFAAGERYLNRAWSTAADGYVDEARAALSRSRAEFLEALARFEASRPPAR
jgi:hypothetical protein